MLNDITLERDRCWPFTGMRRKSLVSPKKCSPSAVPTTHPRLADVATEMPRKMPAVELEVLRDAILNSANVAIIATDANGLIQVFTPGAERLLGYDDSDLVNKKTPAEFHDSQEIVARAEELSAEFATAIAPGFNALAYKASRGITDDYFSTLIRKDGSRFPAAVSITALRNCGTEIIGYLLIATDHSAEAAMIAAEQKKERMKDEFVATVSHELRTPLTSIMGALGLLTGGMAGKMADPVMRLLTIAHTNGQRLVHLLNDILDIEKMEAGKVVFDFKCVEVQAIVEQAIEENEEFAKLYDVRLRFAPTSTPVQVRADPDRLIQVVTNLLSNAVKFSPPGGEVVVAVKEPDDTVRISVRDHGPGIPVEFRPRIFEKFAQVDTADARQRGGTGLGLNIAKAIVARLDGTVGYEDAPGGGTIFSVDLPNWAKAVKSLARQAGKPNLRILLCEDDPNAATVLSERLLQEGFLVDVALTADEAVARVAATPYSAILVDLQLPEGDGIDLIKQLRAQPQIYNTLLVVLSADLVRSEAAIQASTLLNILDWLDAPIDVSRLVRVLDRPIVRDRNPRPRILHVDSDRDALHAVAKVLDANAEVMSVDSIDKARRALAVGRFDVAVLEVALALGSGLELLQQLRDAAGDTIPLVVFSPQETNPVFARQIRAALINSRTPIGTLVATLRSRLLSAHPPSDDKIVK